jgi:hypothetical protein
MPIHQVPGSFKDLTCSQDFIFFSQLPASGLLGPTPLREETEKEESRSAGKINIEVKILFEEKGRY